MTENFIIYSNLEQTQISISSEYIPDNITTTTETYSNSIRSIFNMIDKKEALEILKTYIDKDCMNRISNFIDLRGLASIVLWLINKFQEVNISSISITEDIESSQPLFVEIRINNCDWKKWKYLAKQTKDTLNREGLGDIAGKVVLVCNQAMQIS
jgi:hypothetical protein